MKRAHRGLSVLAALALLSSADLAVSPPSGVAHANVLDSFKELPEKLMSIATKAVDGLKSLPGLLKVGAKELLSFVALVRPMAQCIGAGAKDLLGKLVSQPAKLATDLMGGAVGKLKKMARQMSGAARRELAAGGRDFLKLLRGFRLPEGLNLTVLFSEAGKLFDNAAKIGGGMLSRQAALMFDSLEHANVWPLGCLAKARPMFDKLQGVISKRILAPVLGVVKKLYVSQVVKKIPGLIETEIDAVLGGGFPDAIEGAIVDRILTADRRLAAVLKGDEVVLTSNVAVQLAQTLDGIPMTKPSFFIGLLKNGVVKVIMKAATKAVDEGVQGLLNKLDLAIAGALLPVFDFIAGEVAGLVVPLVLEIVSVEVGGLGAISSIVTASVAEMILVALTSLYNTVLFPYVVAKPAELLVEVVMEQFVERVVQFGVDAAADLFSSSADAVLAMLRDKIAAQVPVPAAVGRVLKRVLEIVNASMPTQVRRLGDHLKNLQGLVSDLAAKKGKVCGVRLGKDLPLPPAMGAGDLQALVLNLVLDKIIDQVKK